MKLHIFRETGEFRKVKFGEWYIDHEDDFVCCELTNALFKGTIVRKIVVGVPDDTKHIRVIPYKDLPTDSSDIMIVSIVGPKTKVKKWQWLYKTLGSSKWEISDYYEAVEDVIVDIPNITLIMKAVETEEGEER